jgi:sigma-B regulation protein RsbU (phosphoserine phosphatase)
MAQTQQLAEFRFPARTDRLSPARQVVRDALQALGCGKEYIDHTVLAVDEATSNVIRHAYAGDENGEVILQVLTRGDALVIRLIDFAPPVDLATIKPRDLDDIRPGGLGTHIIREIMDKLEFVKPPRGAGNVLEMTRKLEA